MISFADRCGQSRSEGGRPCSGSRYLLFDFSTSKSQQVIMKKIGRPKSETSAITLRLPDEMIKALDGVRREQEDIPTRPEMIRRIVSDWLDKNPPRT
jgi:hypothetical protein